MTLLERILAIVAAILLLHVPVVNVTPSPTPSIVSVVKLPTAPIHVEASPPPFKYDISTPPVPVASAARISAPPVPH